MTANGAIRALVGGREYADSQFNRVTDAKRQPGSAFKLFVFLAAFEAGKSPSTVMRDSPFIYQGWQPKNYSGEFLGSISLETAFAKSVNTVAVKLAEQSNRSNVINAAKRLGFINHLMILKFKLFII